MNNENKIKKMPKYNLALDWNDIFNDINSDVNKCIYELVANSFDADAKNVEIIIQTTERKDLSGEADKRVVSVEIIDDGEGVLDNGIQNVELIAQKFIKKGHTDKNTKTKIKSTNGRKLLGRLGAGRYQAFGIGDKIIWKTKNSKENSYQIIFEKGKDIDVEYGDYYSKKGTKIEIEEINKSIDIDELTDAMQYLFGLYIIQYDVTIKITENEVKRNINKDIIEQQIINKDIIEQQIIKKDFPTHTKYNGNNVSFGLIFWKNFKTNKIRSIFLCDKEGITINEKTELNLPPKVSIHIKFEEIADVKDFNFEVKEVGAILKQAINLGWQFHNDIKSEEYKNKLNEFKNTGVYPKPQKLLNNPIEEIETNLFDSVILLLNDVLDLKTVQEKSKCKTQFILNCLYKTMESDVESFLQLAQDLLKLDKNEFNKISQIAQKTELTHLLKIGHFYQDRLLKLQGIKELVTKDDIKERSQLHPIIEDNCWIFGEEHSVVSSDENLKTTINNILEEKKYTGKITRYNGKEGVLDLLCSAKDYDNNYLLIELKAPNVKINKDAIDQVEGYSLALKKYLGKENCKLKSFVISQELDEYALEKQTKNPVDGYIYIYTWNDIFSKLEKQFSIEQKKILSEIQRNEGYKYLQELYSEILGIKS